MRITLQERNVSQKRKIGGSCSRQGPQSQTPYDFEGDTIEFSTGEDDDEGEDSEDDFKNTPSLSQLGIRGKEFHIDRFLRGSDDEDDRKNSTLKKRKKFAPLHLEEHFNEDQVCPVTYKNLDFRFEVFD